MSSDPSTTLDSVIDQWLGQSQDCPCGRRHEVTTQRIVRDRRGEMLAADLAGRKAGRPRWILVCCDENTKMVAAQLVAALGCRGFDSSVFPLPASADELPVPDEATVDALHEAAGALGCDLLIGVGSGTLNDVCKAVATRLSIEYIAYATAASMNGYTSTVAALKRGGLKVTDPVTAPTGVYYDQNVIARAPQELAPAGFADLLSKYVCHADWHLAHAVLGEHYCPRLGTLAAQAVDTVVADTASDEYVTGATPTNLMSALLLSGMVMAMAGSSSPASGGEHLISHFWDMTRPGSGGRRWHGSQVGIGVLITSALYERLSRMDRPNPSAIGNQSIPTGDELEAGLRAQFGHASESVIEQARQQFLSPDQRSARVTRIADRWDTIWQDLRPMLKSTDEIRGLLRRVGAPVTVRELGLDAQAATDALEWARHLRARYTVLDFAADVGASGPEDRRAVLDSSGVMN